MQNFRWHIMKIFFYIRSIDLFLFFRKHFWKRKFCNKQEYLFSKIWKHKKLEPKLLLNCIKQDLAGSCPPLVFHHVCYLLELDMADLAGEGWEHGCQARWVAWIVHSQRPSVMCSYVQLYRISNHHSVT